MTQCRSKSTWSYLGALVAGLVAGLLIATIVLRTTDPVWLQSMGTLAAALVAAAAAFSALVIAGKDRRSAATQAHDDRQHATKLATLSYTEGRYREIQALLVTFDRYAGARWIGVLTEAESPAQYRAELAEFTGRLRASAEDLPRAKQLMFDHQSPTEDELGGWLESYVEDLGMVGIPEIEPISAMVIRAELQTKRIELGRELASARRSALKLDTDRDR